jgi:hypothetical protein
MNAGTTSLDRLHEIVMPPEVPWWPLAPGWYAVFAIAAVLLGFLAFRRWQSWHANAYRRAALRELAAARDAAGIAELLRRTALVIAPRAQIAERTGSSWLDWLDAQGAGIMPEAARAQLTGGVYARTIPEGDISALRDYAARWISGHRHVPTRTPPAP